MGYTDFDNKGSYQGDAERNAEAIRILNRIKPAVLSAAASDEDLPEFSNNAMGFVMGLIDTLDLTGTVQVTVKMLWWLRDLNDKVD